MLILVNINKKKRSFEEKPKIIYKKVMTKIVSYMKKA